MTRNTNTKSNAKMNVATTTKTIVTNVATIKRNVKTNEIPTIVLKTLHDDIMRDNASCTLTTKKMRVKLRATPATRAIHVANASWIFTQSQYDVVRSMFDPLFAQRIAQRAKRDAKKNDAKKNDASSRVVVANVVEKNDAE